MLIIEDSTTYYSDNRIHPPIHFNSSNKTPKSSNIKHQIKFHFTPQSCSSSAQSHNVICSSPTHVRKANEQQPTEVTSFSNSVQKPSNSTDETPLVKCKTTTFEDNQNPILTWQPKSKNSSTNNPLNTNTMAPLNLKFNTFTNTENVTNFYEYTENCIRMLLKLGPKPNCIKPVSFPFSTKKNKKIAVFDIDETLLHCTGQIQDITHTNAKHIVDVMLPMKKQVKIGITIRPHWKEALELIKDHYEIVTYTASHSSYADAVLNYLDPQKEFFKYRLYRNHCIPAKIGDKQFYIKDLDLFSYYDLKNVVIIDNSVLSFAYHFNNGIPIVPYYDSEEDSELLMLSYYLLSIYEYNDLRDANIKHIKLNWFYLQASQDLDNGYNESDSSLLENSCDESSEGDNNKNNNNSNSNSNTSNNNEDSNDNSNNQNNSNSNNSGNIDESNDEFIINNPHHKESVTFKLQKGKTLNVGMKKHQGINTNKALHVVAPGKESSNARKGLIRKKTQIGLGLKQAINSMHQKFVQ